MSAAPTGADDPLNAKFPSVNGKRVIQTTTLIIGMNEIGEFLVKFSNGVEMGVRFVIHPDLKNASTVDWAFTPGEKRFEGLAVLVVNIHWDGPFAVGPMKLGVVSYKFDIGMSLSRISFLSNLNHVTFQFLEGDNFNE